MKRSVITLVATAAAAAVTGAVGAGVTQAQPTPAPAVTLDAGTTTPAYDRDGRPGLSPSEHATVQAVWMQVRGDFAPFDVDVLRTFGAGVPAYVFTRATSKTVAKSIAECVSHEVGHTLGLQHDGRADGDDYFLGHGNWGPLMGAAYFTGVTQWSQGEYAGADNAQDDLAVIAGWLGYAADDYSASSDTTPSSS